MKPREWNGVIHAFHKSVVLPAMVLSIGLVTPAMAQETGGQSAPDKAAETQEAGGPPAAVKAGVIEEIVVTARRKEENVQEVPISISVFNQETLDQRNVVSGSDLATYAPSLTANTRFGPDQASFAIRGFTQELRTTASVGFYFADVVAPRGGGSVTAGDGAGPGAFFDLQNVQVLKGPQGTLFGRNTTGGAILVVPQKPTDKLEAYLDGSAGDYGMKRAQGVINVPLREWARARFGVEYQQRDGSMRNVSGVGPDDMSDIDYIAGRGSLALDLTDSIENYSILTFADSKNNGTIAGMFACNPEIRNGRRVGFATFCDAQLAHQGTDFYTLESPTRDPFNKLEQWQAINTTTWTATDNLTVKNILAYADLEQTTKTSVFGTNFKIPAGVPGIGGLPFFFVNSGQVPGVPTNGQTSFVEELQFQGNLMDNKLVWQGGLYFENSKPDGISGSQSGNTIHCPEDPGTDPATFRCQDVLRQLTIISSGVDPGPLANVQRQLGRVEYENKAVYAQATYSIIDSVKATGGIRYTQDETTGTSQQIVYDDFPGNTAGAPARTRCVNTTATLPDCTIRLSQKSEAPTWLIGFDYLPADDILLYTKYTRGYRQGSINIFGAQGFQTHEPEEVDAYEIGAKTSFGGLVPGTFNIAAFYNDLRDQQIQLGFLSSTSAASPTTGILNAGSSTIQGVEVESTLLLLEDWSLDLSYTYLNTKLEELQVITPPPGSVYDILIPSAVVGGPLAQSPKHKASVTATYRLPLSESIGDVSAGATYVYTDEQVSSSRKPYGTLPAYDLLNLNLNWKGIARSPFDASLFVTNVLDEEYPVFVPGLYNNLGAEFRVVGAPRMWGARMRYSFG